MEIGSPVYCVSTTPNNTNQICVGLEDGQLSLYDVNSPENPIYSVNNPDSIIVIRPISDSVFYGASEESISIYDTRECTAPKLCFKPPSEITDFCVYNNKLAVGTYNDDIILSDKRVFKKAKKSVLPSVCTSLSFNNNGNELVAGYIDTTICSWNLSNSKFNTFKEKIGSGTTNPSVVHCISVQGNYVAAARQTGLALYEKGKCVEYSYFEHDGAVEVVEIAKCFDEPTVISAASDGSLMVLDWKSKKVIDCFSNEGEKVQSITSNSEFIAVADTSDNGNIGIFRPEDFGNKEEEEEEEENTK